MTSGDKSGYLDSRRDRWKRLVEGLLVTILTLLVLYTVYEKFTVLTTLENAARDFQARLRGPDHDSGIVIVAVTDRDYQSKFKSTSPLDEDALAGLILSVASGNPKLIAVDLATQHLAGSDFLAQIQEGLPAAAVPVVVWAREVAECRDLPSQSGCTEPLQDVLLPSATADSSTGRAGVVRARADKDGVIRRYRPFVQVGDSIVESLPHLVAKLAGAPRSDREEPAGADERFIRYRPMNIVFDAGFIEEAAATSSSFSESGVLRDKIVYVGATYREARDRYPSPIASACGSARREASSPVLTGDPERDYSASGVCILAQMTLTELEGGGPQPAQSNWVWAVLMLDALALLVLFQKVSFKKAFWSAVGAIPVLAILTSYLLTQTLFGMWAYAVPLLIAILIQQLYAHAIRYRNGWIKGLSAPWGFTPVDGLEIE